LVLGVFAALVGMLVGLPGRTGRGMTDVVENKEDFALDIELDMFRRTFMESTRLG
jgi:hypothetical protein